MGWCINCHVNGYDPKEGQIAAGYDSVPPANYSGGAPYGTPGTRAGIAMTPPGMGLPQSAAQPVANNSVAPGTTPIGAANAAQGTAARTVSSNGQTPSAERRRARYDCSSCHY